MDSVITVVDCEAVVDSTFVSDLYAIVVSLAVEMKVRT